MSVRLYTVGHTAGMLSLFGTEPGAFDCESGTIGAVLGSHGAASLLATTLALSSLSKSARYVGILYVGITFFTSAIYGALYAITGTTRVSWVSIGANLSHRLVRVHAVRTGKNSSKGRCR